MYFIICISVSIGTIQQRQRMSCNLIQQIVHLKHWYNFIMAVATDSINRLIDLIPPWAHTIHTPCRRLKTIHSILFNYILFVCLMVFSSVFFLKFSVRALIILIAYSIFQSLKQKKSKRKKKTNENPNWNRRTTCRWSWLVCMCVFFLQIITLITVIW